MLLKTMISLHLKTVPVCLNNDIKEDQISAVNVWNQFAASGPHMYHT